MSRLTALATVLCLLAPIAVVGCAELDIDMPQPKLGRTGFLSDYSGFGPHPQRASAALYVKSDAIPAKYDRVVLDPIVIRLGPNSDMSVFEMIAPEEVSRYLYTAIAEELSSEYTPVREAGDGVIRIRAAIIDVRPVPDAVPLWGSGASYIQAKLRSGTVGAYSIVETAIEIEALDSQTDERLAAFTDRRSGVETVKGATIPSQIIDSIDHWAVLFGETLHRKPVI